MHLPGKKSQEILLREKLPVFKVNEGMLHIAPKGTMTFGIVKKITKKTDSILVSLMLDDKKIMIIPADWGKWIDLESILMDEWTRETRMNWD